jgi:LPS-assembly lipoprotein
MQNLRALLLHRLGLRWLSTALSLALICSLAISACGFQLRGITELPFKTLHVQGGTLSILRDMKQSFKTNGIKLVEATEDAELLMEMLGETYEKRILSLSGGGLVREYELNYSLKFRTRAASSPTWSAVQTVQSRRDFSYDDKALLGKAEEEAMLVTDMHKDAVREILRRLSAIKPSEK